MLEYILVIDYDRCCMLQAERRDQILQRLSQCHVLAVAQAVRLWRVGEITIRRDFNALAQEGLVERVRGGIRLLGRDDMQPFGLRQVSHEAEKRAIGRAAAGLLRDGDVAFIDGGTTTYQMAEFLPDCRLRIITNSLRLAARLESRMHLLGCLEVFLTGGLLHRNSGLLVGSGACQSLQQYHAQWAFLSAGGLNEQGVFNTNEAVVDSEKVMVARAERVAIMVDHSKLGHHAMCHVCGLDCVHTIITDTDDPENAILEQFADSGGRVLRASPGSQR